MSGSRLNYERRLAALPKGTTRSFKGTRARVLQEFGSGGPPSRAGVAEPSL